MCGRRRGRRLRDGPRGLPRPHLALTRQVPGQAACGSISTPH
jgi:hypothetical protein